MTERPLITLTTDFGDGSPYVAQMKGVLTGRAPEASLVDVTHAIPPQDVTAGALAIAETTPWFPERTVHIGVVDPGVGTGRRILAGRLARGWFVGPDNGLFSLAEIHHAVVLENRDHWLANVTATFHGRDVMAPVAAALAAGVPLERLGPATTEWVRLSLPPPVVSGDRVIGKVIHVDRFGNLVTNLRREEVAADPAVTVKDRPVRFVRCYGEADPGDLVALIGSSGRLEIAVVNGSGAEAVGRDPAVSAGTVTSPPE